MDTNGIIRRLEANSPLFQSQLHGVSDAQARWKPAPDQWSLLEVVAHLADEELLDFRTRLDLTLHRPGEEWPRIDPERWATERRYNEGDPVEALGRFVAERRRSVAWLDSLGGRDWAVAHAHPRLGPIRAGDLLASWLAHDLIHVRQINRLHRAWLETTLAPDFKPEYAGRW
ncbi:MAG: DinB family protein [Longimicrobiales bacterium]|nr:DinB family protein [Longimicrobiales bacterium]